MRARTLFECLKADGLSGTHLSAGPERTVGRTTLKGADETRNRFCFVRCAVAMTSFRRVLLKHHCRNLMRRHGHVRRHSAEVCRLVVGCQVASRLQTCVGGHPKARAACAPSKTRAAVCAAARPPSAASR
eukprot:64009-Pleurochrysis_carterae.AAC.2